MHKLGRILWTLMLVVGLLPWWGMTATPAAAGSQPIRISQVYGGGGNSGATYTHDFIELFNAGATAVDLSGWSVQYAGATGDTWQVTTLSGSIAPGGYYLIQEAQGSGGTTPLPTPDATGTIYMGGTNGKVALVNSTTALSGVCPTGLTDLVGYGTANCYEGTAAAPALSSTTAALRADGGCTDADDNAADFTATTAAPRNSASPTHVCGVASTELAIVKDAAPISGLAAGDLVTYTVVLANSGTLSDTHVLFTDTLPSEVDFADWIEQPTGATAVADVLTWSGAVEDNASITLTFAVTNLAGLGAAVVNTAEFSGTTQAGSDDAQYTTPFTLPYTQDFSACPATGWLIYSVASNHDWTCGSGYMAANGYGGDVASDDWLVSPAFDFTSTDLETLAFETWTDYADGGAPWPQLSVKYSTDYNGSGDPTTATWIDLTGVTFAPADSGQWTASGAIDVSDIVTAPVYFAFRYVSSGTGGNSSSSWRVDNFALYERPSLSLVKTADPTVADAGEVVTYTVILNNGGDVAIPGVLVTDTLPTEVDFADWIEQPTGATVAADELTWSGAIDGDTSITFTFAVTNGASSGTVVNTAEFSSTAQTGSDDASFTVMGITAIHAIQGDGAASPLVGGLHTIEGIVVGDFQPAGEYIKGFFVQEETADADADPLTSEGLFVYYNTVDVNEGDLVRVSGTVQEYYEMTQLGTVTDVSIVSSGNPLPAATEISLPVSETTYLERYEGMRVSVPQPLYVTEIYKLGRGGELLLSADARLMIPTQVITPGAPATALQAANHLNKLILDDGSLKQNPDPILYPSPFLSATNTVRGGDTVTDIVGVLSYSYSGWSGTDAYRIHPTETPAITPANPRPTSAPDVGGTVRVASFNVLNYFDTFSGCTAGVDGATVDCRGANDADEFTRQRDKIIAAMLMLDADVIGLMEIENDGYADEASAIDDLVDGLNDIAGAGTYAYVDADARTGGVNALGDDAIKVGMLYKPAKVNLTGATAVLDSSVDPTFLDDKNRPALAQAFEDPATGQVFTVVVNHLKSKGSACDGDPDTGDGQGNCNLTREAAAEALVNWLNGDPTGVGSAHALIIGDLNSYAREDPIVALENGGYTNLAAHMGGADMVYSYVFDGQWGTLDYAMASSSLLPYVTDTKSWHINADEPIILDYNVEFKTPGQITSLYSADPYRASDHDPIVVGLDLCIPVTEASIAGPLGASDPLYTGTLYSFAAILTPTGATLPITYTWDPAPQTGQGTADVSYLWATPGSKQITLTVENCGVSLTVTRALTIEALPAVQPVIITEFLPNPDAADDTTGEWLELYNPNAEAIDLQGWTLRDLGSDSHVIAASVILPAGGYVVLGRNADPALNGGVVVAYAYGADVTLANADDEIILTDALGREVDHVVYTSNANGWPTVTAGRALQLCNPAADNNVGSAWSRAAGQWTPPASDYGSPGLPNICGVLAIGKSVEPHTAVPLGSVLTYTIRVTNTGGDAANVTVADLLPLGVDGDDLNWTGLITANTTAVFTIPAVVTTSEAFYGMPLVNTAGYVYFTQTDAATATVTLATGPQLTLAKTVTPETGVFPGDEVTYTLTLHNPGDMAVTGITLTDALPWEMNFVAWIVQNTASLTDDVITWNGDLDGGADAVISFRAAVRSDSFFIVHPVINTATYTADNAPDGAAFATFVLGGVAAPVLNKTVATPDPVYPGDTVTYTLTLSNPLGVAGGVVLTDALPTEVDFGGWIAQNGATVSDDIITWSGDLASGASLVISFRATLHADPDLYGQIVTNTAAFVADNALPGADMAVFTVGAQPQEPLLTLTKAVLTDGDPLPGDSVAYTLLLSNLGGSAAAGIALTDALPVALDFGGWIAQNGATVVADVITWGGDLASGASQTFIFTATLHTDAALEGQTITNTVTATAANAGGASAEIAFTVGAQPQTPLLTLTKAVLTDGDPLPGESVVYTLTLANLGGGDATGVLLTDALPVALDFGGWIAQNGATVLADVITWGGDLASGATQTVAFTATLHTGAALEGQTITNTVTATAANAEGASAEIAFTVGAGGAGALTITKDVVAAAAVDVGGVVTYTLTLSNSGDAPATGVILTDALPIEVDFGDWIADNGASVTADVLTWSGEVGAGEEVTIHFTATVRSDVMLDGRTVTNTARFTWGATGGEDTASFALRELQRIFLPLVVRNF